MVVVYEKLPYPFAAAHVNVDWHFVKFGRRNNLVELDFVFRFADERYAGTEHALSELLELVWAGTTEPDSETIDGLVAELAAQEPPEFAVEAARKWLYVLLVWAYERLGNRGQAWELVDKLYADFGYDERLGELISKWFWGPSAGIDWRQHFFAELAQYLENESNRWGRPRSFQPLGAGNDLC